MLKRSLILVMALVALSAAAAPAQARLNLILFRSPSDNIGCAMDSNAVRCDIGDHSWVAPPKPADCDVDWGNGVAVDKKGKAGYVCAGDTTMHQGGVLEYGDQANRGRFRCTSKQVGMKCVDTDNKHGFLLARDSVKLF